MLSVVPVRWTAQERPRRADSLITIANPMRSRPQPTEEMAWLRACWLWGRTGWWVAPAERLDAAISSGPAFGGRFLPRL